MSHPDWSSLDWMGIVIRGICGAVFGAMAGAGCLWRMRIGQPAMDWGIFGVIVVAFAIVSIRYGDEFWMSLRDSWWTV